MSQARKLAISRARSLRKNETDAEQILWRNLRGRRPDGLKFRRQHPVPPYILDFAERSLKLAIEIDGATHSTPTELAHDSTRSELLATKGWTIIRFSNSDIYDYLDDVTDAIWRQADELKDKKT